MTIAKKSRRTKIRAEHVIFGPCLVIEHRGTPTGNDVVVAEFPDKITRTLLAAPEFWKTSVAGLKAIPVVASAVSIEPDAPMIEESVIDQDEPVVV